MMARRLTLLIALYVFLDLSNPFMPGAFNFDPDESVDGVACIRDSSARRGAVVSSTPPIPVSPTRDARGDPVARAARHAGTSRAVSEWLVDVRRAHVPAPAVSALTEDH